MKTKLETIRSAIEIWNLWLPDLYGESSDCIQLLTADERERADRLVRKKDAERFALSRGLRRRILASYIEQDPAGLRFAENGSGKPLLQDSELSFNVSHSRERILIAVTSGRSVGVDIEFMRDGVPMTAIAQRWFSPEERSFLTQSENSKRVFFDIWSKKEAYVKARGQGIFHALNSFSVPLDCVPGGPAVGTHERRVFHTLDIDPAYAAAVVFDAPPVPVQIRSFPPHG